MRLRLGRVCARRDVPRAGRLRRRGRDDDRRRGRSASASTCRSHEVRELLSAGAPAGARAARADAGSSPPRGRRSAARDIAGAERDLARLVATTTACSSCSATPARRRAPPIASSAERRGARAAEQLARRRARLPRRASTSWRRRCARASSAASSSWPCIGERALLRAAPRERRFVGGARLSPLLRPARRRLRGARGPRHRPFAGIETRTVAGVTRDYLLLHFKGDDKLFVPHDQIGKVTRYVGAGAGAPPLTASAARPGRRSRRAPARPWPRWPASCSTSTPRARPCPGSPSRPTAS